MSVLLVKINNNKFGLIVYWVSDSEKKHLIKLINRKISFNCYRFIDISLKSSILNGIIYSKQVDIQLDGCICSYLEIKDYLMVSAGKAIHVFNNKNEKVKELIKHSSTIASLIGMNEGKFFVS